MILRCVCFCYIVIKGICWCTDNLYLPSMTACKFLPHCPMSQCPWRFLKHCGKKEIFFWLMTIDHSHCGRIHSFLTSWSVFQLKLCGTEALPFFCGELVNPLPHLPILGCSNSAGNKGMISKILINGDTIFWLSKETLWEKKKLLVTSNFFFSHNSFKSCLLLMC